MSTGQFNRDTILGDLRNSVIEVFFTKVNGQDRLMRCTLRPDLLPLKVQDHYLAEGANHEKVFHHDNQDVIRCWSMNDNGWRSFRADSVTYLQDVTANYA